MGSFKIIIQESDMADNAEAVGEDGKLVGVAEMAIDVELLCIRAGSSLGRHKAVSHLVGIDIRFIFIVGFEAADEGIEGLGIVFSHIEFNAGGIESEYLGKGGVNGLADGFGKINHMLEHEFNIRKELLLKTGEERGIGDFGEAAENPEFFAEGKKEDKKGIRRDGKNLLKDEGREETGKGIKAFAAEGLVKSVMKDRRDEFGEIKMLLKELEKGRGIVKEGILTVSKGFF